MFHKTKIINNFPQELLRYQFPCNSLVCSSEDLQTVKLRRLLIFFSLSSQICPSAGT